MPWFDRGRLRFRIAIKSARRAAAAISDSFGRYEHIRPAEGECHYQSFQIS